MKKEKNNNYVPYKEETNEVLKELKRQSYELAKSIKKY